MEKLKQNAFWVGIGAAAAVLLLFSLLALLPAQSERSKKEEEVRNLLGNLQKAQSIPSTEDVHQWDDRHRRYQDEYRSILLAYREYDRDLERWLTGSGESPSPGTFKTGFRNEIRNLRNKLLMQPLKEAASFLVGSSDPGDPGEGGFKSGWDTWKDDDWNKFKEVGEEGRKRAQKRIWIYKRIVETILQLNGRTDNSPAISHLVDVRFFDPIVDGALGGGHGGSGTLPGDPRDLAVTLPAAEGATGGSAASSATIEYPIPFSGREGTGRTSLRFKLPDDLGTMITFGFTVKIMYSSLPEFIRRLLTVDGGEDIPKLLIDIASMSCVVDDWYSPKEKVYGEEGKDTVEGLIARHYKEIKPMPVVVLFVCRVVDLDSQKAEEKLAQTVPQ